LVIVLINPDFPLFTEPSSGQFGAIPERKILALDVMYLKKSKSEF